MLSFSDLIEIHPENLWIEFSIAEIETAWQQAVVNHPHQTGSHRAFINYLCLQSFVKWLEDEPDLQNKFQIPLSPDLNLIRWDFVNGIELNLDSIRLALIPSEQSNICEFRIPNEWVDIPSLAANYYVAVQLNLEQNWLRIWGFISHEQIREKASYDPIDRTYYLKNCDLIADINIMWVARELCPLKKLQVQPLPGLSEIKVNQIIEQLSEPRVYSPRLDISFAEWGVILANNKYLEILHKRRMQKLQNSLMKNTHKIVHNLSLWFDNIFNEGWHSIDDFFSLTDTKTFQFRSDSGLNEVYVKGAKLIDLGMQLQSNSVALLVGLSPQTDNKVGIRVQLYPASGETYLPDKVQLALLSESGKTLQSVESRGYDNYIQLKRFKLPLGKHFSIQVALEDCKVKENFILEDLASKYKQSH